MRFVPESSSLTRWIILGLAATGGLALLLVKLRPDVFLAWTRCPLRETTGIPCPTCGGSHTLVALTRGDLWTALAANPALCGFALAIAVSVLWAALALAVPALRVGVRLGPRERRTARWLAALGVFAAWAYQIWRVNIR
ncbi:MAG: DUF2752 domain-containing protein [bacterium]